MLGVEGGCERVLSVLNLKHCFKPFDRQAGMGMQGVLDRQYERVSVCWGGWRR